MNFLARGRVRHFPRVFVWGPLRVSGSKKQPAGCEKALPYRFSLFGCHMNDGRVRSCAGWEALTPHKEDLRTTQYIYGIIGTHEAANSVSITV